MSKLITLDHLQTTAETTKEYIDSLGTTLQNSIDTKADASDLENYLPLTGGTVTGSVTANEGFVGDLTGNASTADYATSAGTADSATTATNATQDGDGNVITDTYIPKSGNAGTVSYYATAADTTTVDETSADAIETADAVTVSDGTSGTAWVKVVHLTGDSPTVTAGDGWSWSDGETPELETGCFVVACWLGSAGLLTYHNIG